MDSKFQKVCEDQLDWCAKPVRPVASISSKNAIYQTHAHQISYLAMFFIMVICALLKFLSAESLF
jgi:hypothetical protein